MNTKLNTTAKTLIVAAPDFLGRLTGRRVIAKESLKSKKINVEVCSSVLAWDIQQMPIDDMSFAGFDTGWQDLRIAADVSNNKPLAWLNNTNIVIGNIYTTSNELVSFAPRALLQKQIDELRKIGLTATVATELEFYLIPIDETNEISPQRHDFSIDASTNKMAVVFDEITNKLKESGVIVESWQAEWGRGQWEINLKRGNPLDVADSHTIFKLAVKEIALKHGYRANFMAKPFSSEAGSSCHIHISLKNTAGKEVLHDSSKENMMSDDALSTVAGILHYTPELMPLYANTINSYRRLAASEFCGNGATWGFDNRTTTCRVIGRSPESLHIEFRIPGADTNPYLSLAGLIASIRKGITEKMKVARAVSGNAGDKDIKKYPMNLESATEKFLSSSFIKHEFGTDFVSEYGAHLQHEITSFQTAVTDWEINRYSSII